MKLKMRRRRAHRKPEHLACAALSQAHQCTRTRQGGSLGKTHAQRATLPHLVHKPVRRYAPAGLPTRPAPDVQGLKVDRWRVAQIAAEDQRVPASVQAANRPHPGQIARLEKEDECYSGEGSFRFSDNELDRGRAEPPDGGALPKQRQAALHPTHQRTSPPDVSDRSNGKPGDHGDCENADDSVHRAVNDNTRFTDRWKRAIREFAYGLSAYEIAQQALELRATMETLFILGVFGDMLGVPVLPPYYGLRILPFVVPQIESWKRRLVRERELGTDHEHHLHGL